VNPVGKTVENDDLAVDFAHHDLIVASNRYAHLPPISAFGIAPRDPFAPTSPET
jgi:hypothetical protein